MENKEIIIDGVDVSGCEFYNKDDKTCREVNGKYDTDICEFDKCENSNCYYKQLKRKEQEYEDLRQYHNKCCEEFEREKQNLIDKYNQFSKDFFIGKYCKKEYCELLKAKEQECEELKRELQAQRDFTAHEQKLIYCVAYDETCKTGNDCKQKKCVFKDRLKYKQTLAEIKPILEFYANSNMGEEQPDKTYHIMLNGSYIMVYDPKPARQALQKISECAGENK